MKVKGRFDHFNINVTDLDKSIKFYETALGLHESHRKEASDGSFRSWCIWPMTTAISCWN